MTAEDIIYELYRYFQVNNNIDLAEKLKISQQTISNWKSRNSLSAIKKKCRELGIYAEIFGSLDLGTTINQGNNSRAAGKNYKEETSNGNKYNFDNITIGLIEKAIEKFGSEEEFQFQFMDFLREK